MQWRGAENGGQPILRGGRGRQHKACVRAPTNFMLYLLWKAHQPSGYLPASESHEPPLPPDGTPNSAATSTSRSSCANSTTPRSATSSTDCTASTSRGKVAWRPKRERACPGRIRTRLRTPRLRSRRTGWRRTRRSRLSLAAARSGISKVSWRRVLYTSLSSFSSPTPPHLIEFRSSPRDQTLDKQVIAFGIAHELRGWAVRQRRP